MNKLLSTLSTRFLTPGEQAAFQHFYTELRISRFHRRGLREVRAKGMMRPKKLNVGCGPHHKEGFLNVDLFPGGDLSLDLRRNLPFESNCCEMIFSEHFVEHLDYPGTVANFFRECLRILTPNGLLRFSVPDTEWPLIDYAKGPAAEFFRTSEEQGWHPECKTRIERINYHFRQDEQHRFAYDEETAKKVLSEAGFVEVQRVPVDPALDSKHRQVGSLIMSARKPA